MGKGSDGGEHQEPGEAAPVLPEVPHMVHDSSKTLLERGPMCVTTSQ